MIKIHEVRHYRLLNTRRGLLRNYSLAGRIERHNISVTTLANKKAGEIARYIGLDCQKKIQVKI